MITKIKYFLVSVFIFSTFFGAESVESNPKSGKIYNFIGSGYGTILDCSMLPYTYTFSDRDDRNLCFQFVDTNEIEITNRSRINSQLIFTDLYKIHFDNDNKEIVVDELIGTNRSDTAACSVISPFDVKTESNNRCGSIFPILKKGDIIYCERHYQFLAINKFTFNIVIFSQRYRTDLSIWLMKNYNSEKKKKKKKK